jgi:hypothetical protein
MRLSLSDRPREKLVRLGRAYVCDLSEGEFSEKYRGTIAEAVATSKQLRSTQSWAAPRIGIEDLRQLHGVGLARGADHRGGGAGPTNAVGAGRAAAVSPSM